MLYFHTFEQIQSFRNVIKIVLEQVGFKHASEIPWQLLAFMEAALEVVRNLSNVRNMIILNWLGIFFCKLKLNLASEQKLNEEIHNFAVLFIFKVLV